MQSFIGVIDCNNFFVSCERLFRPDLEGKPVLVLSSNDGCVVARSQEVKDMSIPMGVPYFQIKDIIKDKGITCFSSHFSLYRDISARVFTVVKELLSPVEIYSIDEAFFAIKAPNTETLTDHLRLIKEQVERRVGIPVTLGVAYTKTQAKLVNARAKRRGGIGVADNNFVTDYATVALGEVWGVGGRLALRYGEAKIKTVQDLVTTDPARLSSLFGVTGIRLQSELSGVVAYPLTTGASYPKSLTSSRSFANKTSNQAVIKDALAHHITNVFDELRQKELVTGCVKFYLGTSRYGDFASESQSFSYNFATPIDSTSFALRLIDQFVEQHFKAGIAYNKVGIVASMITPKAFVPVALFAPEETVSKATVIDLVRDTLNQQFGYDLIGLGKYKQGLSWQAKEQIISPSYTTNWADIPLVKTN